MKERKRKKNKNKNKKKVTPGTSLKDDKSSLKISENDEERFEFIIDLEFEKLLLKKKVF